METSQCSLKTIKNSFIQNLSIQDLSDPVLNKKFDKFVKTVQTKPQK